MRSVTGILWVYLASLAAFLVIDAIWIGVIAKDFYLGRMGHLMADTPNIPAAAAFYLIFVAGVVFFAVGPALERQRLSAGLLRCAFFGLVTYGTWDLTGLALLRNWPVSLTLVDMGWGMTISVLTGLAGMGAGGLWRPQAD